MEPGRPGRNQEAPGGARRCQEEPGASLAPIGSSWLSPGLLLASWLLLGSASSPYSNLFFVWEARWSQVGPGGARWKPGNPGRFQGEPRGSQEEPGGARGSQERPFGVSWGPSGSFGCLRSTVLLSKFIENIVFFCNSSFCSSFRMFQALSCPTAGEQKKTNKT